MELVSYLMKFILLEISCLRTQNYNS